MACLSWVFLDPTLELHVRPFNFESVEGEKKIPLI